MSPEFLPAFILSDNSRIYKEFTKNNSFKISTKLSHEIKNLLMQQS